MENRLPVPTDNIFKFYALFGLLLFVFSCGVLIHVNDATNETILKAIPEIVALHQNNQNSAVVSATLLSVEKRIEVARSDRSFFANVLVVLILISIFAMYYGFMKWHKVVQPESDRLHRLQCELNELQIEKLRTELRNTPGGDSTTSKLLSS